MLDFRVKITVYYVGMPHNEVLSSAFLLKWRGADTIVGE